MLFMMVGWTGCCLVGEYQTIYGDCQKCSVVNCSECDDNICSTCLKTFTLANDLCSACLRQSIQCSTCTEQSITQKDVSHPLCFQCCSYKEMGYFAVTSCSEGFYLQNYICLSCQVWGCLKCSQGFNCQKCLPELFLKKQQLVECLYFCPDGTYPESKNCLSCWKGCFTCNGPSYSDCITCNIINYFYRLSNNICMQCFLIFYLDYNTNKYNCKNDCPQGYGKIKTSRIDCIPCSNNCKTCTLTTPVQVCLNCKDGFFMKNKVCTACPTNCYNCTSSTDCSICFPNFYSWQKQCIVNCPSLYYKSEIQRDCRKCQQTCPPDLIILTTRTAIRIIDKYYIDVLLNFKLDSYLIDNIKLSIFKIFFLWDKGQQKEINIIDVEYVRHISTFRIVAVIPQYFRTLFVNTGYLQPRLQLGTAFFPNKVAFRNEAIRKFYYEHNSKIESYISSFEKSGLGLGIIAMFEGMLHFSLFGQSNDVVEALIFMKFNYLVSKNIQIESLYFIRGLRFITFSLFSPNFFDQTNNLGNYHFSGLSSNVLQGALIPIVFMVVTPLLLMALYKISGESPSRFLKAIAVDLNFSNKQRFNKRNNLFHNTKILLSSIEFLFAIARQSSLYYAITSIASNLNASKPIQIVTIAVSVLVVLSCLILALVQARKRFSESWYLLKFFLQVSKISLFTFISVLNNDQLKYCCVAPVFFLTLIKLRKKKNKLVILIEVFHFLLMVLTMAMLYQTSLFQIQLIIGGYVWLLFAFIKLIVYKKEIEQTNIEAERKVQIRKSVQIEPEGIMINMTDRQLA